MRHYLATLHKKSPRHKNHFALAVSGGFTLLIFAIWTVVNFGQGGVLVEDNKQLTTDNRQEEVSPLESMQMTMASAWEAIGGSFSKLLDGFGEVDLESGYEEMREKTLDTYGPVRSSGHGVDVEQ